MIGRPGQARRAPVESMTENVTGWRREQAQDVVEYVLILGFVALSGAAILTSWNAGIDGIWSIINSRLTAAGS